MSSSSSFSLRALLSRVIPLLVIALVLPTAASAAEKGVQTDLTWGISADDQQRTIAALDGTGVQWIRMDISWHDAEVSPGVYDPDTLAMTDHALDLALQTGAKVLVMVNE